MYTSNKSVNMTTFKIKAIEEDFNYLFALNDSELKEKGMIKITVDQYPGYPCRISLEDAQIGEEVLLFPYKHHKTTSPYQASGPIFIRKNVQTAILETNEIPKLLNHRHLSLRCYDKSGIMIEATTCNGKEVRQELDELFKNSRVSYVHIHNAKPGCYNCVAERV